MFGDSRVHDCTQNGYNALFWANLNGHHFTAQMLWDAGVLNCKCAVI